MTRIPFTRLDTEGAEGFTDVPLDRAVSLWFREHVATHEWVVDLGEVVAVGFHPWVFRGLLAGACVLAWRAGHRRAAVVAGATMVVGSLLGLGMKLLVARPRPAWGDPVATEVGYSMPSGHALNAALGVGLLLMLAWPWLRARGWTRQAVAVGGVVVALTVLDRLALGVHYVTDVGVGVLLGGALVAAAYQLTRRATARAAGRREHSRG
jgi:undecaprenyl-diphosphatase